MGSRVEGAGVELAYRERGAGPPVLLVHGMAADAAAWEPALDELAGGARVIAYDRRGYGDSGAPEPYERTTVNEQAEDAAALLRALDVEPAVLWAEDFGALVALDLLRRHPSLVRGAVLVAPPLYALRPEAMQPLAEERLALEEALREHGPEAAVERWLAGRLPAASPERLARARAAHGAFFADYGGLASWPVTRRELRAISAPVAVLAGEAPAPHVGATAVALAGLLPGALAPEVTGEPLAAVRRLLARTA